MIFFIFPANYPYWNITLKYSVGDFEYLYWFCIEWKAHRRSLYFWLHFCLLPTAATPSAHIVSRSKICVLLAKVISNWLLLEDLATKIQSRIVSSMVLAMSVWDVDLLSLLWKENASRPLTGAWVRWIIMNAINVGTTPCCKDSNARVFWTVRFFLRSVPSAGIIINLWIICAKMFLKDARKQVHKTELAPNVKPDTKCQDISALKKKSSILDAMFIKAKPNATSARKDIGSKKDIVSYLKNPYLRLVFSLILLLVLEILEELEGSHPQHQLQQQSQLRLPKLQSLPWTNVRSLIQEAVDA